VFQGLGKVNEPKQKNIRVKKTEEKEAEKKSNSLGSLFGFVNKTNLSK